MATGCPLSFLGPAFLLNIYPADRAGIPISGILVPMEVLLLLSDLLHGQMFAEVLVTWPFLSRTVLYTANKVSAASLTSLLLLLFLSCLHIVPPSHRPQFRPIRTCPPLPHLQCGRDILSHQMSIFLVHQCLIGGVLDATTQRV